jgi:hypothetical protein
MFSSWVGILNRGMKRIAILFTKKRKVYIHIIINFTLEMKGLLATISMIWFNFE